MAVFNRAKMDQYAGQFMLVDSDQTYYDYLNIAISSEDPIETKLASIDSLAKYDTENLYEEIFVKAKLFARFQSAAYTEASAVRKELLATIAADAASVPEQESLDYNPYSFAMISKMAERSLAIENGVLDDTDIGLWFTKAVESIEDDFPRIFHNFEANYTELFQNSIEDAAAAHPLVPYNLDYYSLNKENRIELDPTIIAKYETQKPRAQEDVATAPANTERPPSLLARAEEIRAQDAKLARTSTKEEPKPEKPKQEPQQKPKQEEEEEEPEQESISKDFLKLHDQIVANIADEHSEFKDKSAAAKALSQWLLNPEKFATSAKTKEEENESKAEKEKNKNAAQAIADREHLSSLMTPKPDKQDKYFQELAAEYDYKMRTERRKALFGDYIDVNDPKKAERVKKNIELSVGKKVESGIPELDRFLRIMDPITNEIIKIISPAAWKIRGEEWYKDHCEHTAQMAEHDAYTDHSFKVMQKLGSVTFDEFVKSDKREDRDNLLRSKLHADLLARLQVQEKDFTINKFFNPDPLVDAEPTREALYDYMREKLQGMESAKDKDWQKQQNDFIVMMSTQLANFNRGGDEDFDDRFQTIVEEWKGLIKNHHKSYGGAKASNPYEFSYGNWRQEQEDETARREDFKNFGEIFKTMNPTRT